MFLVMDISSVPFWLSALCAIGIISTSSMEQSRRFSTLLVLAKGTTPRKDIERQLDKARKRFAKARQTYDKCRKELEAAEAKCSEAENELDAAKGDLIRFSRTVKMLDLTGGEAVRDRGELETYMIGGKEFHAELDDNNDCVRTEWKSYRKQQRQDAADAADSDSADGTELEADISLADDDGEEAVTECEKCGSDVKMKDVCVDCGKSGCSCGGPTMKAAVCTNKACGEVYEEVEEEEKPEKKASSIFDQITKSHEINLPRYR